MKAGNSRELGVAVKEQVPKVNVVKKIGSMCVCTSTKQGAQKTSSWLAVSPLLFQDKVV